MTGPCIALKMEGGNDYLLQNLASDDIKCDMYMKFDLSSIYVFYTGHDLY